MQAPKFTPFQMSEMLGHHEKKNERAERYKDVPLIVAPGQEEAYLKHLEKYKNATTVTAKRSQHSRKWNRGKSGERGTAGGYST